MSIDRARPAARPAPATAAAAPAARQAAEVILVTHDAALERTLRAASPATPIRVATTPAALADLLMTGRAGALVLDVGALDAAAGTVARRLAEQFPDVPLVAVGSREQEARLAGLISGGHIYRFLHRPVSAPRARTFVAAALRRAGEIGPGARPSTARPVPAVQRHRLLLACVAAGAAAMLGLGLWLARRAPPAPAAPAAPAPALRAAPAESRAPAAGQAITVPAPAPIPGPAADARTADP